MSRAQTSLTTLIASEMYMTNVGYLKKEVEKPGRNVSILYIVPMFNFHNLEGQRVLEPRWQGQQSNNSKLAWRLDTLDQAYTSIKTGKPWPLGPDLNVQKRRCVRGNEWWKIQRSKNEKLFISDTIWLCGHHSSQSTLPTGLISFERQKDSISVFQTLSVFLFSVDNRKNVEWYIGKTRKSAGADYDFRFEKTRKKRAIERLACSAETNLWNFSSKFMNFEECARRFLGLRWHVNEIYWWQKGPKKASIMEERTDRKRGGAWEHNLMDEWGGKTRKKKNKKLEWSGRDGFMMSFMRGGNKEWWWNHWENGQKVEDVGRSGWREGADGRVRLYDWNEFKSKLERKAEHAQLCTTTNTKIICVFVKNKGMLNSLHGLKEVLTWLGKCCFEGERSDTVQILTVGN